MRQLVQKYFVGEGSGTQAPWQNPQTTDEQTPF